MSVSFPSGQLKSIQIEAISMPARSQFKIFTDNIYIMGDVVFEEGVEIYINTGNLFITVMETITSSIK